jgi:hypothetical protein
MLFSSLLPGKLKQPTTRRSFALRIGTAKPRKLLGAFALDQGSTASTVLSLILVSFSAFAICSSSRVLAVRMNIFGRGVKLASTDAEFNAAGTARSARPSVIPALVEGPIDPPVRCLNDRLPEQVRQ